MKLMIHLMLAVFLAAAALAQDVAKEQKSPQAILLNATIFGFGVKLGQDPNSRKTGVAYRALLSRPDAVQQFAELFKQGNIHAKCYSLCALHKLDPKRFSELGATLDEKQLVRVRDGCVVDELSVKELIKSIKAGRYADGG